MDETIKIPDDAIDDAERSVAGMNAFSDAFAGGYLADMEIDDAVGMADDCAANPHVAALMSGVPPDHPAFTPEAIHFSILSAYADARAGAASRAVASREDREESERANAVMTRMFDAAGYDDALAGRALFNAANGDTYLLDKARAAYYRN